MITGARPRARAAAIRTRPRAIAACGGRGGDEGDDTIGRCGRRRARGGGGDGGSRRVGSHPTNGDGTVNVAHTSRHCHRLLRSVNKAAGGADRHRATGKLIGHFKPNDEAPGGWEAATAIITASGEGRIHSGTRWRCGGGGGRSGA